MKTNKKAVLGFAIAMIFSLAIIQGFVTNNKQDFSLQQVSLSCASMADSGEGNNAGWLAASGVTGAFASGFYVNGLITTGTVVGVPVGVANFLLGGICTL